jgi:hypothetical protein
LKARLVADWFQRGVWLNHGAKPAVTLDHLNVLNLLLPRHTFAAPPAPEKYQG